MLEVVVASEKPAVKETNKKNYALMGLMHIQHYYSFSNGYILLILC